jgi:4-methylaminobutanoate oxidase (formaldehyde-forming)
VPVEQCATLYDALCDAGRRFGLKDAGYYTIDALRIEAGRRAWGAELSPDETPWEAGLGYAVKLDKPAPFLGAPRARASASSCSRSTTRPHSRGAASRS